MRFKKIWMTLPYAILLALAAWFYHLASNIDFTRRGDNLGPDFWPKLALISIMAVCAIQGLRFVFSDHISHQAANSVDAEETAEEAPQSAKLLAAGLFLTIAYGAFIGILGFLIATTLFMILFMYAGTHRAHMTIWLSSIIGAVAMTILFQKIVYVSLPRGVPPFDQLSEVMLSLF